MHWFNVFTVIVAAGAAVLTAGLSYLGTQRATRRQLQDALAARLDADAAEHRRWLRDHAVAAYMDLLGLVDRVDDVRLDWLHAVDEGEQIDVESLGERLREAIQGDLGTRLGAFGSDELHSLWKHYFLMVATTILSLDAEARTNPVFERVAEAGRNVSKVVRREMQLPTVGIRSSPPRLDSNQ